MCNWCYEPTEETDILPVGMIPVDREKATDALSSLHASFKLNMDTHVAAQTVRLASIAAERSIEFKCMVCNNMRETVPMVFTGCGHTVCQDCSAMIQNASESECDCHNQVYDDDDESECTCTCDIKCPYCKTESSSIRMLYIETVKRQKAVAVVDDKT
jgi:hypothetical protein